MTTPLYIAAQQQIQDAGRVAAVNVFLRLYANVWRIPMPSIGPRGLLIQIQPDPSPFSPADYFLMLGTGATAKLAQAGVAGATLAQQSPDLAAFIPGGPPPGYRFAQPTPPDGTVYLEQSTDGTAWTVVKPTVAGVAQAVAAGIAVPGNLT